MKFISKYSLPAISLLIFSIIYFILRLYHLGNLPIFTDEAIYVRWAQIAKNDATWRFISLTDGKQPMFIWAMMITMKFIKDPLIAGRMVSVFCGFLSMIGMFFLGNEMFKNKKIGVICSFLYLIYPFAVVYDRMALYDTMVAMFAVWSLYFIILVVRNLRLDMAMTAGIIVGGSVLTKTSGFFNIYLLPLSLFLFDFKKQKMQTRIIKLIGLWLVITVLTYACYTILRLSPFFHIIDEKNALFVFPIREWLKHPFTFYFGNLTGLFSWYASYVTLPIIFVTFAAFFINVKKSKENFTLLAIAIAWMLTWIIFEVVRMINGTEIIVLEYINLILLAGFVPLAFLLTLKNQIREKLFLLLWFLLPFIALALFGKTIYPRFIYFMTIALLPLAAYSIFNFSAIIKNKYLYVFFCVVIFAFPIFSVYKILTNFATAPIPYSDLAQYNNDWPAGGGVKEAINFFRDQAQNKKIFVATEGTFGLMPYSFEIYLKDNPNITIKGFWPINDTAPKELTDLAKKMPVYIVFYQPCPSCQTTGVAPSTWGLTQVMQYEKYSGNRFLTIYKVNP